MQDAKEEVRSRLNIEDVIGEYVQLKRAGRNFKGLSPYSGEKTPSFYVSPDKQIWHDFSSNKGGDVFSFVMEAEGMDFRQALEHLAKKAGVDLALYESSHNQSLAKQKKRIKEALELSARYYQECLVKNPHALDYVIKKRGLSKDTLENFKIGYSPSSGDALVNFLTKKGFSKDEMSRAGLLNRFGGDLFRSRMMVPLMDVSGLVIGFTARIIDEDPSSPKYLNTPQTLLYDKGRHVFGLSQAKEAIRTIDYAVIVEGNLDVVSSHQAGIKYVVASAGTAMTENHLKALSRLTKNIRLAFDGDKAGLNATERAIPIAQNVDMELSIIEMPEGAKDPDELIKKDSELWVSAIENARPAIDWVLEQYEDREDISSPLGKRRYVQAALRLIRKLQDSVEREHYLNIISKKTNTTLDTLKNKLENEDDESETIKPLKPITLTDNKESKSLAYEDSLLALAMMDSGVRDIFSGVDLEVFETEEARSIVEFITKNKTKLFKETPVDLQKYDTYVKILLLRAETRYDSWSSQDRYFEAARLLRQVILEHKKKQKNQLLEELRQAESDGDDVRAQNLREKINHLIKEIQSGSR